MLMAVEYSSTNGLPYGRPQQVYFAEENRHWADTGIPLRDLGYRNPYTLTTASNGLLFLGDSVTAGQGVPENVTFVELMRQTLAPLPVVNMAVIGSGTENMDYQLRNFADAIHPRLVICVVSGDDLRRLNADWLMMRVRPVGDLRDGALTWLPAYEAVSQPFLYYHSRIYQIDNYLFRKRREQWMGLSWPHGRIYALNDAYFGDMAAICRRINAKLVVVFNPPRPSLTWPAWLQKISAPVTLRRICEKYQVSLFDLTPRMLHQPDSYYLPNEGHFNETGHRMAFEEISRYISEQHLLDTPPAK
jgi:lysophospholipase L1-like esterase